MQGLVCGTTQPFKQSICSSEVLRTMGYGFRGPQNFSLRLLGSSTTRHKQHVRTLCHLSFPRTTIFPSIIRTGPSLPNITRSDPSLPSINWSDLSLLTIPRNVPQKALKKIRKVKTPTSQGISTSIKTLEDMRKTGVS